jgi:hypothetical protein
MNKKPKGDMVIDTDALNVVDLTPRLSKRRGATGKPKKPRTPKRPRTNETFVRLPYHRITQAYGKLSAAALHVMIELDHQHFKGFGKNPVTLTNQTELATMGMHRYTKARALRQLRDAGLVSYTQTGQQAYIVTLTWHPVL